MRNLTVTKQIKVSFSPEQWELYTYETDCSNAARELNRALELSFNEGADRREVYKKVSEAMERNAQYGTCDSEPIYFLESVLEELYHDPNRRNF